MRVGFLLGERSDGDLDDVDPHRAVTDVGELIVAVQGGPSAELAPGRPPDRRVVVGDVAVEVTGGDITLGLPRAKASRGSGGSVGSQAEQASDGLGSKVHYRHY